jgi:hypothetical protein
MIRRDTPIGTKVFDNAGYSAKLLAIYAEWAWILYDQK